MHVFAEVATSGSFSATADKLDMSRAMVTRYVSEMEQWLQARLLQRTTRSVTLTDAGEQLLRPGMCAGFPPGSGDGHQLVNRGSVPAVYLEISNRVPGDSAFYPDVDLMFHGVDAEVKFTRKDGSRF